LIDTSGQAGAVAASILTTAYHMLHRSVFYQDLGPEHFDRSKASQTGRLVKRLPGDVAPS